MSGKHLIPIDDLRPAASFWAEVIETRSTPGDVVMVPFAEDATIAKAAVGRERRAVLLARTPAQQLRHWSSLVSISNADKQRALARLAATTKRDTPLDLYIQDLYQTTCPHCGEPTPATAFIWDPARKTPVEKELACGACEFRGRAPVDDRDTARATRFERRGLSFWFILEWLVDSQDTSGREIARRRLDEYSPRNLTALADITRKIDAELSDDPTAQRILRLWLLHALDAGRQQPDPVDKSRIIEHNVWHLLAHAPAGDELDVPTRLTTDLDAFFRQSDPTPNVSVVAGPIRQLARQLPANRVALMLGTPPALDVDRWIWEQLWSRWVFGRGESGGLQPPVGGWARHVRALGATMAVLAPALRADAQVIFRFQDNDPDRAAATLMAASLHTGLEEFVYQPALTEPTHIFSAVGGTYDMTFTLAPPASLPAAPQVQALAEAIENAAVDAANDVLRIRAEPLPFGWIFAAVAVHLARSGLLRQTMVLLDADISPLAFTRQHVRQGLRAALSKGLLTTLSTFRQPFGSAQGKAQARTEPRRSDTASSLSENTPSTDNNVAHRVRGPELTTRYGQSGSPDPILRQTARLRAGVADDKPTHWWLPDVPRAEPLAERVEETVTDLLNREAPIALAEVYRRFPGWLTPEAELVEALLAAYGEEIRTGKWGVRAVDPTERQMISDALHRLGKRLGFSVGAGIADVVWGEEGHATHAFRVVEAGRWDDLGVDVLPESVAGYLVLPDRLVDLLRVKLVRNPLHRRELAQRGWSPVKAQHLLAMADARDVDRQEFKKIVGLEPIIEQDEAQIPLF